MASSAIIIKLVVGETGDFLESVYKDQAGAPINITGYTFLLTVTKPDEAPVTFAGVITNAAGGAFNRATLRVCPTRAPVRSRTYG